MVESEVLKFGDFTLKKRPKIPVFHECGAYVTGSQLHRLGRYARAITIRSGWISMAVSAPLGKGIPLSVITTMA